MLGTVPTLEFRIYDKLKINKRVVVFMYCYLLPINSEIRSYLKEGYFHQNNRIPLPSLKNENMKTCLFPGPIGALGVFGSDGSEEWLLPLLAKEFIEDHDIEWRNLDYNLDLGPPPSSFFLFMCHYDFHVILKRLSHR